MLVSNLCWLACFLLVAFLIYQAASMVHENEVRYRYILQAHQQQQRSVEERATALTAEILRLRQLNEYTATHVIDLASNLQSIIQTAHGAQVDFLEWIVPQALRIQISHGIPASATVAMAIYESNYGRSVLATEHHNYFGIKALSNAWRGEKTLQTTRDRGQVNQAWFRRYSDRVSCVTGYAEFLKGSPHYRSAFAYREGKKFVQSILAGGYCPDKDYLANIQLIIQRHLLSKLDLPVQVTAKADSPFLSASR
jgi:flagellum-specific peptidoglycan hydrolase FlgJ